MRLVTYSVGSGGAARAGVRVGHRVLDIEAASRVKGEPLPSSMKALFAAGRGAMSRVQSLAKAAATEARSFAQAMHEERAIRFLPPVPDAERFLCVGGRPRNGDEARNGDRAAERAAFVISGAGLVGHDVKVAIPEGVEHLACTPTLVFVIARSAQDVKREDAMDYVAGVTILSDLRCADAPKRGAGTGSRAQAAGDAPLGSPLGPEIITLDEFADPGELWMTGWVNGEERLRVNARDQVARWPDILEHFSRERALEPGDLFGACSGAGPAAGDAESLSLKAGDVVDCAIEGMSTLRSTIVAAGSA